MRVIYVAGPFRSINPDGTANQWKQELNVRAAEALAYEVWKLGAACICPHTNTRFYQGAAPDDIWLQGDLAILERCDAVLMTPDWRRSQGASAEHDFAETRNIRIFYNLRDLSQWIDAQRKTG